MEFTEEYQKDLILRMTDQAFMEKVSPILRSSFFDPNLHDLVDRVLSLHHKTRKCLSQRQLRQAAGRFKIILPKRIEGDSRFDFEEVEAFAKEHLLREGVAELHVRMGRGEYDKAVEAIVRARRKFPHEDEGSINIFKHNGRLPSRKNLCPTGLETLDGYLKKGVGAGEVAAVMAKISGGKSSWLCHVACTAAEQGKRVLLITLEIPKGYFLAKVKARLVREEEPSEAKWKKALKKIKRAGGDLTIRQYEAKGVSAAELDSDIKEEIDVLVVDYADFLRPLSGNPGLAYQDLGDIYSELKNIGMRRKIPVWTATQSNRPSYDKPTLDTEDTEGSLQKAMRANQIISICQSRSEAAEETEEGKTKAVLWVAKNTFGERFKEVKVRINWATSSFEEGHWDV